MVREYIMSVISQMEIAPDKVRTRIVLVRTVEVLLTDRKIGEIKFCAKSKNIGRLYMTVRFCTHFKAMIL